MSAAGLAKGGDAFKTARSAAAPPKEEGAAAAPAQDAGLQAKLDALEELFKADLARIRARRPRAARCAHGARGPPPPQAALKRAYDLKREAILAAHNG